MGVNLLEQSISNVKAIPAGLDLIDQNELALLLKDLEDARLTIFIKTKDAAPLLERCAETSETLKQRALDTARPNDEGLRVAFSSFEKAVMKLRNTIMVRTQRAT